MSQADWMRLFSTFDEVEWGDFTPDELQEMMQEAQEQGLSPEEWKRRYFEFYDDIKDKSLKKQDW